MNTFFNALTAFAFGASTLVAMESHKEDQPDGHIKMVIKGYSEKGFVGGQDLRKATHTIIQSVFKEKSKKLTEKDLPEVGGYPTLTQLVTDDQIINARSTLALRFSKDEGFTLSPAKAGDDVLRLHMTLAYPEKTADKINQREGNKNCLSLSDFLQKIGTEKTEEEAVMKTFASKVATQKGELPTFEITGFKIMGEGTVENKPNMTKCHIAAMLKYVNGKQSFDTIVDHKNNPISCDSLHLSLLSVRLLTEEYNKVKKPIIEKIVRDLENQIKPGAKIKCREQSGTKGTPALRVSLKK